MWKKKMLLTSTAKNPVGKGEIALYEQFLLFSCVFKRLLLQTHKNKDLFGS